MARLILLALAIMAGASTAHAALRITFDPGGAIDEYISKYYMLADVGAKIVIDGPCISACTLVTAIVPDDRVCVTFRARLAFHSAWRGSPMAPEHASEGTRLMWNMLPRKIRDILLSRGWNGDDKDTNEHRDLIYIEGDELRTIYRDCSDGVGF